MEQVYQDSSVFSALLSKMLARVLGGLRWLVSRRPGKQTRAQGCSWCGCLKHFAKPRSSSKAPCSVETSHWFSDLHLGTRNRGFLCVRVRRLFPSLVKLLLFQTCGVQVPAWTGSDSSSGLTLKQLIPSELPGRVVGELHWHVVGVEPPKQVSQELNEVRDEGTSNTSPGFVTTARTMGNADVNSD